MIKLVGEKLQQYDLNRQVEIIPTGTVLEVKFLNRSPNPFEVAFTEENGRVYADVPNVLLKTFGVITVETLEMLEDGSQIEQRMTFNVDKRKKPEGYECPADEILTPNHIYKNASGSVELPFGKDMVTTETVLMDHVKVTGNVTSLEDARISVDNPLNNFNIAKKYRLIVNGEKYQYKLNSPNSSGDSLQMYVGTIHYQNKELTFSINSSANVGGPCSVYVSSGMSGQYYKGDFELTITLVEIVTEEVIRKIPAEYLPSAGGNGGLAVEMDYMSRKANYTASQILDAASSGTFVYCFAAKNTTMALPAVQGVFMGEVTMDGVTIAMFMVTMIDANDGPQQILVGVDGDGNIFTTKN